MDALLLLILGVVVIAVATRLAPRLNIAGPLILVIVGLGVSLLPFVPAVEVDPEIILVGILPPLLYSAAVSLPALEFRRDFGPIAGLSVVLVVISALVLGAFFMAVIPGLNFFFALALGAILSPTDAVATSIVKRLGISPRVVTLLEGESLLNDATSLVILRTAVAAAIVGTASPGEFIGSFVWGVVVAVVIGGLVGFVNLRFRFWIGHSAANTAIGFVIPFAAYLPTEHLGGSGLVAPVVAGIVTGQGSARWSTPEQRLSDSLNWRTVELLLEGAVFLIMGLELKEIVGATAASDEGLGRAVWLTLAALGIVLVVRSAYVAFIVWLQSRRARGKQRERLEAHNARLDALDDVGMLDHQPGRGKRRGRPPSPAQKERRIESLRSRVSRALADLDYYQASPLGWKHGTIIVWAGMRGVVTLAAAQTLPRDTPERELLVLVAFLVAVGSLMLQGFTLPWLVKILRLESDDEGGDDRAERERLDADLREAAASALVDPKLARRDGTPFPPELLAKTGELYTRPPDDETSAVARDLLELRLALIDAMRVRLTEVSRGGAYSTPALRHTLAGLDADQLSLELRLEDAD